MATFLLALLSLNLVAHDLESFRRAASEAKPGDQILLAPGTYRGTLHLSDLRGTEEQPILLGASDPTDSPVIDGNVQISGASILKLATQIDNMNVCSQSIRRISRGSRGGGLHAAHASRSMAPH